MVAERSTHLFEVEVPRSSPVTSRETQKKVLVGTLVGFLGLALAVALVSPDGRVLSINGSRQSVTHRVVMSATRTFQSLDDAPAADAAAPSDDAAKAKEETKKKKKDEADKKKAAEEDPFKPDEGVTMEEDKIVLLGDEELNAAMAKYYEAHPSAFQWSLWQQIIGGLIALICVGCVIYSEVNAMLLTRDLDALKAAELLEAPPSVELQTRNNWWGYGPNNNGGAATSKDMLKGSPFKAQWRIIFSGAGLGMCCIAIFVAFTSECPMLDKLSVKYDLSHTHSAGNCLVMAFLLAIVNGVGASALCAGIIWMCTRPLPGILLLLISVSSDFYNTSDDWFALLMWMLIVSAVSAGYVYFTMDGSEEEEEKKALNRDYV